MQLIKAPLVETRLGPSFTSIGHLLKFDLTANFPATMAKKLFFKQVSRELYCFLKGYTSKADLHAHGVRIWDKNMEEAGLSDIGPIYGWQWRRWGANRFQELRHLPGNGGFDQLRFAINELIKSGGTSRRALVSAWNPPEVLAPYSALPPCHVLFQFNVVNDTMYTDVYQRSADAFLGLPFDVASFAVLSRLVSNELTKSGFAPLKEVLNYHVSNMHLYLEHEPAASQEIANEPSETVPLLTTYDSTVDTFHYDRCELLNYAENRVIKAKLLT